MLSLMADVWLVMAGAGVKKGYVYGATDEFGYYAVEDRMHIHDMHATMLHLRASTTSS
jgi:hypothetical protein